MIAGVKPLMDCIIKPSTAMPNKAVTPELISASLKLFLFHFITLAKVANISSLFMKNHPSGPVFIPFRGFCPPNLELIRLISIFAAGFSIQLKAI